LKILKKNIFFFNVHIIYTHNYFNYNLSMKIFYIIIIMLLITILFFILYTNIENKSNTSDDDHTHALTHHPWYDIGWFGYHPRIRYGRHYRRFGGRPRRRPRRRR
jgi:uncharacterized membrane protein